MIRTENCEQVGVVNGRWGLGRNVRVSDKGSIAVTQAVLCPTANTRTACGQTYMQPCWLSRPKCSCHIRKCNHLMKSVSQPPKSTIILIRVAPLPLFTAKLTYDNFTGNIRRWLSRSWSVHCTLLDAFLVASMNNSVLGSARLRSKQPVYTSDKRAKFTQRENKKYAFFSFHITDFTFSSVGIVFKVTAQPRVNSSNP